MNTVTISTEAEARRRQERLRLLAGTVRDGIDQIGALVTEAKESNDHEALGYASWTAYLADTLGAEAMRLDRAERREVVALLAGEGMSSRAIAPIVGVTDRAVRKDIAEVGTVFPPAPPVEAPTRAPGGGHLGHAGEPTPPFVTGLDGKAYSRPEPRETSKPRQPPRRALTDQFFDAAYDLGRAVEKVHRLTEDDRWSNNKAQIASKHENDLRQAADLLAEVLRSINPND